MTGQVLGLDIGGTASRAWLAPTDGGATDTGPSATATGPSASLVAAGRDQAERVIAGLLTDLGIDPRPSAAPAEPPLEAACVGSAGSGTSKATAWIAERLAPYVTAPPADRIVVVNDSHLALYAEGLEHGIAVISGTGSVAVAVSSAAGTPSGQATTTTSTARQAGGWGYLLGDEGSGYWIAREAVRELCRRNDESSALGDLGEAILGRVGVTTVGGLIERLAEESAPARWASLAPTVLDSPDPFAATVLHAAAAALSDLVVRLAGGMSDAPTPVVLAGGLLANHAGLREATTNAIEAALGPDHVAVRTATRPPVVGAVAVARRLARSLRTQASPPAGTME